MMARRLSIILCIFIGLKQAFASLLRGFEQFKQALQFSLRDLVVVTLRLKFMNFGHLSVDPPRGLSQLPFGSLETPVQAIVVHEVSTGACIPTNWQLSACGV